MAHHKNRTSLVTFLFLMTILLTTNSLMVAPYLLAVIMGGIVALILAPVYQKLKNKKLSPNLAALLVTVTLSVVVIVPVILFMIASVDQALDFGKRFTELNNISFKSIQNTLSRWKPLRVVIGDPTQIENALRETLRKAGEFSSAALLGIFGSLPEMLLQLALFLVSCFFLLIDGKRFYIWVRNRIPLDSDVRKRFFDSFKNTAVSTLFATIAAAAAQAILVLIVFLCLGIPAAFLAAGLTFLFAWFPFLGSMPVAFGGAVYLYYQKEYLSLVILVVAAALIGISDNLVRAYVLKGREEMHPLVGLVAIFGGISAFGIFGVFVGPILAALLISVLQIWPAVGQRFGLFECPEPLPIEPKEKESLLAPPRISTAT